MASSQPSSKGTVKARHYGSVADVRDSQWDESSLLTAIPKHLSRSTPVLDSSEPSSPATQQSTTAPAPPGQPSMSPLQLSTAPSRHTSSSQATPTVLDSHTSTRRAIEGTKVTDAIGGLLAQPPTARPGPSNRFGRNSSMQLSVAIPPDNPASAVVPLAPAATTATNVALTAKPLSAIPTAFKLKMGAVSSPKLSAGNSPALSPRGATNPSRPAHTALTTTLTVAGAAAGPPSPNAAPSGVAPRMSPMRERHATRRPSDAGAAAAQVLQTILAAPGYLGQGHGATLDTSGCASPSAERLVTGVVSTNTSGGGVRGQGAASEMLSPSLGRVRRQSTNGSLQSSTHSAAYQPRNSHGGNEQSPRLEAGIVEGSLSPIQNRFVTTKSLAQSVARGVAKSVPQARPPPTMPKARPEASGSTGQLLGSLQLPDRCSAPQVVYAGGHGAEGAGRTRRLSSALEVEAQASDGVVGQVMGAFARYISPAPPERRTSTPGSSGAAAVLLPCSSQRFTQLPYSSRPAEGPAKQYSTTAPQLPLPDTLIGTMPMADAEPALATRISAAAAACALLGPTQPAIHTPVGVVLADPTLPASGDGSPITPRLPMHAAGHGTGSHPTRPSHLRPGVRSSTDAACVMDPARASVEQWLATGGAGALSVGPETDNSHPDDQEETGVEAAVISNTAAGTVRAQYAHLNGVLSTAVWEKTLSAGFQASQAPTPDASHFKRKAAIRNAQEVRDKTYR